MNTGIKDKSKARKIESIFGSQFIKSPIVYDNGGDVLEFELVNPYNFEEQIKGTDGLGFG